MKRLDLINSIQRVSNAIIESNINDVINSRSEKMDLSTVLTSLQTYSISYNLFDEDDKLVLEAFGLTGLNNPKTWTTLINKSEAQGVSNVRFNRGIRFLLDYMPKVVELLKQGHINYVTDEATTQVKKAGGVDVGLLSIILPELRDQISKPERLVDILESINGFYSSIEAMLKVGTGELTVAAIDSGSDKTFDFLGNARVIEMLKDVLFGIWDRIVYYRERKAKENLELISQSLPIIEKVNEMVKSNAIDPEDGERLKRQLTKATEKFLKAGALIPEFETQAYHEPRLLVTAEPKLLGYDSSKSEPERASKASKRNTTYDEVYDTEDAGSDDNLSAEEQKILNDLQMKRRGTK